ncbi:hypothetical protein JST99_02015, partial [Candidatus Dependentiae bacterium]|nr:hypothetical protein [Candidatus Dependentiae bacterium]
MSRVYHLRNRDIVVNTDNRVCNTKLVRETEVKMDINAALVQALSALRPQIGELPSFSGANSSLPEEFTTKFKQYALVNGYDEEKMMLVVPLCLKESALTWFEGLDEDAIERTDWESFKEALINRYHDKSKDLANFTLFMNRKQKYNETVQEYITEMKKIARNVRDSSLINESVKVMTILNGMLQRIRINIQLSGELPRSVAALESRAVVIESAFELNKNDDKGGNHRNKNENTRGRHRNGQAADVGGNNRGVTCYGCGKEGHIKPNCPDAKSSNSNSKERKEIVCYWCNEKGHISRDCPNPKKSGVKEEKKDGKSNVRAIDGISNVNINDEFTSTAHVGDVRVTVMFDTGACVNCMSEEFYQRMNKKVYPLVETNKKIRHAGGGEMPCAGEVTLPVEFDGESNKPQM